MCEISTQAILNATRKFTYSQALEAGHSHSGWLIGPMTDLLGQVRALVSHSVSPERAAAQKTRDTCGQLFGGSSPSDVLQQSLENRLRARLAGRGSVEYVLTWKRWDMPSGLPICALRASAHRTSANASSGWPTADAQAFNTGADYETHMQRLQRLKEKHGNGNGAGMTLGIAAQAAGWPTAMRADGRGSAGRDKQELPNVALLTGPAPSGGPAVTGSGEGFRRDGWGTPRADESTESYETQQAREARGTKASKNLHSQAELAGWATSRAEDAESVGMRHSRGVADTLTAQSRMAGYPTPRTVTGGAESQARKAELGRSASGGGDLQAVVQEMQLPDMTDWKLNPRFSLWLMGYPDAWASCGARAMQSCRRSRRRS